MKRNNLLTGFLMAFVIWGMSACTSTGPLTKCPDMKPQQEKQVVFKKKKDNKSKVRRNVAHSVPIHVSKKQTTPSILQLQHRTLVEIDNKLASKGLSNSVQPIPVFETEESLGEVDFDKVIPPKKAIIAANQPVSQTLKVKKKEIRHAVKQSRKNKATLTKHLGMSNAGLLLIILAVLVPPLAMFIFDEGLSNRFWISLILTFIGYVPGLIYTLVVILND